MATSEQRSEHWRQRHRLKIGLLVSCGVVLTSRTLVLHWGGTLSRLELDSVDARSRFGASATCPGTSSWSPSTL
jgi:hypothetical protein